MEHTESDRTAMVSSRPRRHWWKTLAMSALILVCGMAIGSGLTLYIAVNRVMETIQNPQHVPERMTARMKSHLDLTDEQAEKVRAILESGQEEYIAIREQVQPQVRGRLEEMQAQIEAVLTPEQVERFRERVALLRERLQPQNPDR